MQPIPHSCNDCPPSALNDSASSLVAPAGSGPGAGSFPDLLVRLPCLVSWSDAELARAYDSLSDVRHDLLVLLSGAMRSPSDYRSLRFTYGLICAVRREVNFEQVDRGIAALVEGSH